MSLCSLLMSAVHPHVLCQWHLYLVQLPQPPFSLLVPHSLTIPCRTIQLVSWAPSLEAPNSPWSRESLH